MNELKLLLQDERRNFRPGESLEGVAGWRLGTAPNAVELRLFWYTRGKGTDDVGLVNQLRFEAPRPEDGRRFNFVLPDEPYSFSGHLISLLWAVELVVDPGNQAALVEFVMSPSGQEILLHPHARA